MFKTALSTLLLGSTALVLASAPVLASPADDTKAEIEALRARLDQLEAKQAATAKAAAQAQAEAQAANASAASQAKSAAESVVSKLTSGNPVRIVDSADTKVTLYGLLEPTFSHITHANSGGGSQTGYQVSWFSGNRWGIDGEQAISDWGGGLKLIGKLESEFELPTGSMDTPGTLFNRDAWLGFMAPDYGKLTFGRQNTLARDFSATYGDPYGSASVRYEEGGYTNVNNFKQLIFYSGGGTTSSCGNGVCGGSTRINNGIVWKKLFDNGLVLGAQYAFGSNAGGGLSLGSAEAVAIGYNGGAFNVSTFYNHTNVPSATGSGTRGFDHQSEGVGGNYTIGMFRFNTGYFHYTGEQGVLGTRTDNAYTASVKFAPPGSVDYEVGYQIMDAHNAGLTPGGFTFNAYSDMSGATQASSGAKHTAYGSVIYHPVKNIDLYLAGDVMNNDKGYHASQANGFSDQIEIATGARWKF